MTAHVRSLALLAASIALVFGVAAGAQEGLPSLDQEARRWVDRTLASLSLDERVGQVRIRGIRG